MKINRGRSNSTAAIRHNRKKRMHTKIPAIYENN